MQLSRHLPRYRTPRRTALLLGGLLSVLILTACAAKTEPHGEESTASCESVDLAETAFGPYTALNQVPTIPPEGERDQSGFWRTSPAFQISHIENHFDPCAALSWVILFGSTNQDPPGTESSALLLFHHDQLLKDPLPIQLMADPKVERVADESLEVTYEYFAVPEEEQGAELLSTTLTWEDEGDVVTRDDQAFRREYARQVIELDLNTPAPQDETPVLPLGNIHHRPLDAEHELAEYPDSNVRISIDEDSELLCVLKFAEYHHNWGWVGCIGHGVEWPYVEPPFAPPTDSAARPPEPGESANYLRISLEPAAIATAYFDDETMPDLPVAIEAEADTLTRVGHYLIDTRGEHPRLIYGGTAIEIREDGFDSGPANILDRSRW
ncbi:hypothetical protein COCCU_00820 [Corynebacterium occultum]|uniref:Lipoprotein n=1 Tax=Corynebacterium occultum TaxID=2675219 RepID=A0A6B8VL18_9CORY|nr:LppP/LprE family lipoprotein [Corynebacterium occultum]QGU06132.1 hypothetical protein COCCU_00820 [Corynebacterium occultum]